MEGRKIGQEAESLHQKIQKMTVPDRIQLALKGNKEARTLLIRDSEKAVQLAVIENPRISEREIISIAASRHVHEEVLRKIAMSRKWTKLYPVRLALVQNPKTPIALSMKLLHSLMLRDLRALAKSKAVPHVISQGALRCISRKA